MSDTTDLMGVRTDGSATAPATDAPAAPATGAATAPASRRRRSGTGLDGMVLAELQQVASGLGIKGTARMRKSQLIEVIKEKQAGGSGSAAKADAPADSETKPKRRTTSKARTGDDAAERPAAKAAKADKAAEKSGDQQQIDIPGQPVSDEQPAGERRRRRATAAAGSPDAASGDVDDRGQGRRRRRKAEAKTDTAAPGQDTADGRRTRAATARTAATARSGARRATAATARSAVTAATVRSAASVASGDRGDRRKNDAGDGGQGQGGNRQRDNRRAEDDDDFEGGRRGRRGRYRDRRGRRGGREDFGNEPQVSDDDVLIPVAGILDILDNYAFIRTSGYLPGPNDVYVSLAQVRKNGLRKGDHVTGAVRQPKDGERREKFNALVRLDTVNGVAARTGPRPGRSSAS